LRIENADGQIARGSTRGDQDKGENQKATMHG
jgi:hypothetical protein